MSRRSAVRARMSAILDFLKKKALLAQLVERTAFNRVAKGSSPLQGIDFLFFIPD